MVEKKITGLIVMENLINRATILMPMGVLSGNTRIAVDTPPGSTIDQLLWEMQHVLMSEAEMAIRNLTADFITMVSVTSPWYDSSCAQRCGHMDSIH